MNATTDAVDIAAAQTVLDTLPRPEGWTLRASFERHSLPADERTPRAEFGAVHITAEVRVDTVDGPALVNRYTMLHENDWRMFTERPAVVRHAGIGTLVALAHDLASWLSDNARRLS